MKPAWGIAFLLLFSTQLHAGNNDVRVSEVKGSAEYRLAVDQPWKPLKAGDVIPSGAWIQTGLGARVYILFWTNTVAQIKSASLVQITGVSRNGKDMAARIRLSLGTARVHVDKHRNKRGEKVDFKIVSPTVTTSIKGTDIQAERGPLGTKHKQFTGMSNHFQRGEPTKTERKGTSPGSGRLFQPGKVRAAPTVKPVVKAPSEKVGSPTNTIPTRSKSKPLAGKRPQKVESYGSNRQIQADSREYFETLILKVFDKHNIDPKKPGARKEAIIWIKAQIKDEGLKVLLPIGKK